MTETQQAGLSRNRLMRSAQVLKALFEHRHKIQLELLTEAPGEPLSEGVQFDLTISSLGLWGMRSSGPLSEKQQSEISATFHGLLGALGKLQSRRDELAQLQSMYENIIEDLPDNVVPLRRRPRLQTEGFASINDKRWILKLDCLIESPSIDEIHKMALELHSQSQRTAFVNYRDLGIWLRQDAAELIQLGAISLFVPSLLELSLHEQTVLRQVIDQNSLQRPLLMVGATRPYSDLRTEPTIHLELLVLLSRVYIKLTKPFAEYKDQGLIHYFLDSLSQGPS